MNAKLVDNSSQQFTRLATLLLSCFTINTETEPNTCAAAVYAALCQLAFGGLTAR